MLPKSMGVDFLLIGACLCLTHYRAAAHALQHGSPRSKNQNDVLQSAPIPCVNQTNNSELCESGLCYDAINVTNGEIEPGCATYDMCRGQACTMDEEHSLFICCCAHPFCNGKSHRMVRARWRMFKAGDYKADKPVKIMRPRDVASQPYTPPTAHVRPMAKVTARYRMPISDVPADDHSSPMGHKQQLPPRLGSQVAPTRSVTGPPSRIPSTPLRPLAQSSRGVPIVADKVESPPPRGQTQGGIAAKNPAATPTKLAMLPKDSKSSAEGDDDVLAERRPAYRRAKTVTKKVGNGRSQFDGPPKSTTRPLITVAPARVVSTSIATTMPPSTTQPSSPIPGVFGPEDRVRNSSTVQSTRSTPTTMTTSTSPNSAATVTATQNAMEKPASSTSELVDHTPQLSSRTTRTLAANVASTLPRTTPSPSPGTTDTLPQQGTAASRIFKAMPVSSDTRGAVESAGGGLSTHKVTTRSPASPRPTQLESGEDEELMATTVPWYLVMLAGFLFALLLCLVASSCMRGCNPCDRCASDDRRSVEPTVDQSSSNGHQRSHRNNRQLYYRIVEKNGNGSLLKVRNVVTDDSLVSRCTAATTLSSSSPSPPNRNSEQGQKSRSSWWKRRKENGGGEVAEFGCLEELTVIDPLLNKQWSGRLSKPEAPQNKAKH